MHYTSVTSLHEMLLSPTLTDDAERKQIEQEIRERGGPMKVWVLKRHWHERDEFGRVEKKSVDCGLYGGYNIAELRADLENAFIDARYDGYVASVEQENKEAEKQLELARRVIQDNGLLTRHLRIGRERYETLEKWAWRIENNEGWYEVIEQEVL